MQAARTRARRRLDRRGGAAAGVGVIGFPLLFETQPRPMPVDIPIEMRRASSGGRRCRRRPRPPPRADAAAPAPAPTRRAERAGGAGRRWPTPPRRRRPPPRPQPAPRRPPRGGRRPLPAPAAAPRPPAPPRRPSAARRQRTADGERRAAPRPRPPAVGAAGRRASSCRSAPTPTPPRCARRAQRVEKLGLKTYTQVVETDGRQAHARARRALRHAARRPTAAARQGSRPPGCRPTSWRCDGADDPTLPAGSTGCCWPCWRSSVVVGLVRGFVFEALALAGWVVAWFAAQWAAPQLAPHLPLGEPGSALQLRRGLRAGLPRCRCVVWAPAGAAGAPAGPRHAAVAARPRAGRGFGLLRGAGAAAGGGHAW
ncbi:MAG: CvpA family protein [Comamonadaceae bacterium]|nr:CvpA family protein [Comamonadaceae bacterium]